MHWILKYLVVGTVLLHIPFLSIAQSSGNLDYLISSLETAENDSERLTILLKLSDGYKQLSPQRSLDYAQQALNLANDNQDTLYMIHSYRKIGAIYSYISSYDLALEQHLRSLELAEAFNAPVEVGFGFNSIGGTYYDMQDYDMAFKYFHQALVIRKEIGDESGMAASYNNVGEIYRIKGNLELAEEYYWRASELNDVLRQTAESQEDRDNHKRWLAVNYNNLGLVYWAKDEVKKAENFLLGSVELYKEDVVVNHSGLSSALSSLGDFYLSINDNERALDVYLSAYLEADEVGDLVQLKVSSDGLARTYKALGDYERALLYSEIHAQLRDSIFDEEKHRQVLIVQSYFETERKKEENEKLTYMNQVQELEIERRTRERYYFITGGVLLIILVMVIYGRYRSRAKSALQLQRNVEEKEILIQEIHHRVKNNLQMISSLLNLQSAKITDESVLDALDDSKSRVNSMALVHQKLYQTEEFSNINFQEYIDQLVINVAMSYDLEGKIESKVDAAGFHFGINTAIPLGLIVNELLTNSYKHAFIGRKSGNIDIKLVRDDDRFVITIKDDGVGLPDDFTFEETDSLGLELVSALTEQLDGSITYRNENGARIDISFAEVA